MGLTKKVLSTAAVVLALAGMWRYGWLNRMSDTAVVVVLTLGAWLIAGIWEF